MSILVADCPRCGSLKIAFDVLATNYIETHYNWQRWFETFCICRNCNSSTVFVLSQKRSDMLGDLDGSTILNLQESLNNLMNIEYHVSLKDNLTVAPPKHLPSEIEATFKEAVTCLGTQCWNAAGAMFRKCLDLATKSLLPSNDTNGLNGSIRYQLAQRLEWLFNNSKLPVDLKSISDCIREDGNDSAHHQITKDEAEDLLDFTTALLERLYTEPQKLELAKQRRENRRKAS